MKIRNITNNKYEIRKGSLAATVLLTARNGNWYYRSQGSDKKIAAKTSSKDEALAIAANRIFDKEPSYSTKSEKGATMGDIVKRYWKAYELGEIENGKGRPICEQHAKAVVREAYRVCNTKNLDRFYFKDLSEKQDGVFKIISTLKSRHFISKGKVLREGQEYVSAAKRYNAQLKQFRGLFKKGLCDSIYSDLDLDAVTLAIINNLPTKKLEKKPVKTSPESVMRKMDLHFSDQNNFTEIRINRVGYNVYVRYWIARCCGLRKSEIINARHDWLKEGPNGWTIEVQDTANYKEGLVSLSGWSSKSTRSRKIPIPSWLVMKVKQNKLTEREDEPICHHAGSCKLHRSFDQSYSREFRKAYETCGGDNESLRLPTHNLRKEFITYVGKASDLATASEYAGHSSMLTTEAHYFDKSKHQKRVVIDPLGQSLS